MRKSLHRPSPAMIVAILALAVALGGTAVAGVKLSKNSVKTKTIKNNAVTTGKIKDGAVTSPKIGDGQVGTADLAPASKTIWAETNLGAPTTIPRQSGGVSITPDGAGKTVVNFGTDVSKRSISITPLLNLGLITAEYGRCLDIGCGAGLTGSPNAIEVFTWTSDPATLVSSGFSVVASP